MVQFRAIFPEPPHRTRGAANSSRDSKAIENVRRARTTLSLIHLHRQILAAATDRSVLRTEERQFLCSNIGWSTTCRAAFSALEARQ